MVKKKWFLPSELVVHNTIEDIWVCVHGRILDLTPFVKKYIFEDVPNPACGASLCNLQGVCICKASREIKLIIAFAGKDVTHWFKDGTAGYLTYTHAVTLTEDVYAPHGTWPQLSGAAPNPKWRPAEEPLWFEDDSFLVGYLTKNPRSLKIINTLTGDSDIIEVCEEETIYEIMEHRYLPYNRHYSSYTWTNMGRPLELDLTLTANGIGDHRPCFYSVALPGDLHVPSVMLYYNDDCTEDLPDMTPECLCNLEV